jgi:hypothetical protein
MSELPTVKLAHIIDSSRDNLREGIAREFQFKNFNSADNETQDKIDSMVTEKLWSIKAYETDNTVEFLNENTSRFQPLITGGVGDVNQQSITGSAGSGIVTLGLQYRITRFKAKMLSKSRYVVDPHYIYVAWNALAAKSDDSSNILKRVLFPELTKNDFILGYHHDVTEGNFTRGIFGEVSFATYNDTLTSVKDSLFRTQNFTLGYQVSFTGNLPNLNVPAGFKAQVYCNIINIDPKYNAGVRRVTKNENLHHTFFNIGARIQAEVNGATLFFNGKYILNPHGGVSDPDLVRFVYTVGTLVSL